MAKPTAPGTPEPQAPSTPASPEAPTENLNPSTPAEPTAPETPSTPETSPTESGKRTRSANKPRPFDAVMVYDKEGNATLYVAGNVARLHIVNFQHEEEPGESTFSGAQVWEGEAKNLKDIDSKAKEAVLAFNAGVNDSTVKGYVFKLGDKVIILNGVTEKWVDSTGEISLTDRQILQVRPVSDKDKLWQTANGQFGDKFKLLQGKEAK